MEDFTEEIDDQIQTGFYVTNIPRGILKKFKKLCKQNYGDIYWVGISELIKKAEKYDEISTIISSLQKQIDDLKEQIDDLNGGKNVKNTKTFG